MKLHLDTPEGRNTVTGYGKGYVAINHHRHETSLVLLPDLLETYRARLLEHQNVVRAEVTTAAPLSDDRRKVIERSLAQVTGRTVVLTTRVAPEMIGGLVARIGSTVYDGSVTTQLEKMRQRLVAGG